RVREGRPASRAGRLLELPVIGRVAAGSPMLAQEHVQERFQVDPNLFTPRADYLLRVRGMSMRDAGILEGDLLAVHRTQEGRTGHAVQLLPENPDFEPIEVDLRSQPLVIEGIAVGVIRNGRAL